MVQYISFSEDVRVEWIHSCGIVVWLGKRFDIYTKEIYERLFFLIDGTRTVRDIEEQLSENIWSWELPAVLNELDLKGYIKLQESETHIQLVNDKTIDSLCQEGSRIKSIEVSVVFVGEIKEDLFRFFLDKIGVNEAPESRVVLCVTESYFHPEMAKIMKPLLNSNKCVIPLKPLGESLCGGPLFTLENYNVWFLLLERLRVSFPAEYLAFNKPSYKKILSRGFLRFDSYISCSLQSLKI